MKNHKARFDADSHYTKQEINDVIKLQEKGKLDKKNIRKMRKFILKDVKLANALESEKKGHQDLTNLLVENLKQAKRKDLIKHFKEFGVLKSNGEVKTDWQSQMKLVQIMLKYRYNKYHGEIDGKMGPGTFKALLDYQTENYKYRNLTLSAVNTFLSSKGKSTLPGKDSGCGRPDGIADGRTILSFFEDVEGKKKDRKENKDKESKGDSMEWKEGVDPRDLKEVGGEKKDKKIENSDIPVPPFNPSPGLYPDGIQVPDVKEMIDKQTKFDKQKQLLGAIIGAFGNLYPNTSEGTTIANLGDEFNKTNADNIIDKTEEIVKMMSSILKAKNKKFSNDFDKNITTIISKVTATEPKNIPSIEQWENLLKSNIVPKNMLEVNISNDTNNTNADETLDLNTSSIDKNSPEYNKAVDELKKLIENE